MIGIIAILAGVVLVAINPGRTFKQANDTQRTSNVNAILNAIGQNVVDDKGTLTCGGTPKYFTGTGVNISNTVADLYNCLVPTYIANLPFDTKIGQVTSATNYDTGYKVSSSTDGRVTITATPELASAISVTR